MRRQAILSVCAVLFLVARPQGVPASVRIAEDRMLFTELPPMGAPIALDRLINRGTPGDITSTMMIHGLGQVCRLDESSRTSNPIFPFGPEFRGPLDISLGPAMDGMGAGLLIAGSSAPADRPLVLFSLETPPLRLGETPIPDIASGGLRSAIGNVIGDRTPEMIFSSGPGGSGQVNVVEINRDNTIVFEPFGPGFRGGVFVATGDVNGDGHAEVLVTQEQGGELSIFEILDHEARQIATGRPFGHEFSGGMRVAAGDLNNDGFADILTSPITGPPRIRVFDVSGPVPVVIADFSAFDREHPGGVTAAPGLSHGAPMIVATNGPEVSQFVLKLPAGHWERRNTTDPFQRIANILMGVDLDTPPAPARPQR